MIRRVFRQTGAGKFLLLCGISLLFGLGERTSGPPALTLHVLAVLNDQYYALFAVLPAVLFLCGGLMEDESEAVLLRCGSYARYFFTKWRALVVVTTMLWLGQLAALGLSGWGLSLTGPWPDMSGSGLWWEVFDLLQTVFYRPEPALFCAAIHMLAGYWITALLALWLGHFLPRTRAVQMLVALYILTVLQMKLPRPPLTYLTGLSHWILMLHNLTEPWRFPLTAAVTALVVAVILYTVRFRWQKRPRLSRPTPKGLLPYYRRVLFTWKNLLLAVALVSLLTAWTWARGGQSESGRLWVVRLLAGYDTGEFYPIGLLALLLAEVFPLWPLGSLVSWAISGRSVFLTVRLRQRADLLWSILGTAALWLLLWGALLLTAEVLPVMILDLPIDPALTIGATILRLLDMVLQFLLFLAVLCLTGQTAVGFAVLILFHFLAVLPLPWLPVGLSSLLRLALPETSGTISLGVATVILSGCCALLLAWLRLYGIKRLFEKIGG